MLAYLGGGERISALATELFDSFAATGRNPTTVSAVTAAELLVRPFRRGPASVATAESFLRHFGDLRVIDVSYTVAREAARIRAATELPMPDALIAASASVENVDVLVTNDRAWPERLSPLMPDVAIVVLDDCGELRHLGVAHSFRDAVDDIPCVAAGALDEHRRERVLEEQPKEVEPRRVVTPRCWTGVPLSSSSIAGLIHE